MELEEQQRRERFERQKEDMIKRIPSSVEYTARALRSMNPPINSAQDVTIFGTHSDIGHNFQRRTRRVKFFGSRIRKNQFEQNRISNNTVNAPFG